MGQRQKISTCQNKSREIFSISEGYSNLRTSLTRI